MKVFYEKAGLLQPLIAAGNEKLQNIPNQSTGRWDMERKPFLAYKISREVNKYTLFSLLLKAIMPFFY